MATGSEVAETVGKLIDAFNSRDIGEIDAVIADSGRVLGIGSDPDEWWVGRERLVSVMESQLAEMGGALWELRESVSSDGWMASKVDVRMPDGSSVSGRITVACTPDGKVEHFHFSIGVANEAAIAMNLTT
ncbi:MAG TPA: nuclear transport factor 2 family protein [Candidatus Dormibacteraeota bacterium]